MGPRPPLPSEVAQYDERATRRLSVKPGLTGYWQVSGRSDTTFDDMVDLDLWVLVSLLSGRESRRQFIPHFTTNTACKTSTDWLQIILAT